MHNTFLPILVIILLSFCQPALAEQEGERQEPVEITNRSRTPQYIDGEAYYFHAVLRGQTLYSIARAYGVSEEEIIEENPDIRDGLRYDQVIRIPVADDLDTLPPIQEIRLDEVAPKPEGDFIEHEVKRQETLFGLSQKYGVSQENILYYNPEAREVLKVGQVLVIPVEDQDSATEGYRIYTVQSGETKYGIATEHGITVAELESLNPGIKDGLRAGQQIRLPLEEQEVAAEPVRDREQRFIFLPRETKPSDWEEVDPYCHDPGHRDVYNVGLILPLFLESLELKEGQVKKIDTLRDFSVDTIPEQHQVRRLLDTFSTADLPPDHRSFSFISYYHGVLLALDSIQKAGADIRLHVFDGCNDISKVQDLTATDTLEIMDLIIGPFHERPVQHIAAYGQMHDIPVVSPMLPDRRQLRDNPNLFKIKPSLETMLAEVAGYVARNYPRQNIIIVHDNQPGAAEIINNFRDTLLTRVAMVNHFYDSLNLARVDGYYLDGTLVGNRRTRALLIPDTAAVKWVSPDLFGQDQERRVPVPANVTELIYKDEGMEGLLKSMRQDRKNVLITLIGGEPFVSDYLRQLHENRRNYHMSIFGIPDWENYMSIEIDYLQNLNVHYFNDSFYHYSDDHIRDFVRRYRQLFFSEPDEDAFNGAQTAYFFFSALLEYGMDFTECIQYMNRLGQESPFAFQRAGSAQNGWENTHTAIYRIKDYRWVDVTRPMELAGD